MKTVYDQMGNKLELPTNPTRIVSLVPSLTELLYYLGCGSHIIGQTVFCIHPQEYYKKATKIGGTKKLNISKIRHLQPDLIIGNKEENTKENIDELKQDFPVWMSDIENLETAIEMIESLGAIVGQFKRAQNLTNELTLLFQDTLKAQKSCLYLIWREPWMAVGKQTFIHDLLCRFGWQNVCAHQNRYPILTANEIKMLNPEYIFLSSEPFPFKQKHVEELALLVPSAKIVLVDGELFSWYGSRLLLSAPYMQQLVKSVYS